MERLLIPPSVINGSVVGLSKDSMSSVVWDEATSSFKSGDGLFSVAEVADAPPASIKLLESVGLTPDKFEVLVTSSPDLKE